MANEPEVAETGVYFDTQKQKVVRKQPPESIQLVAPGHVIDDNARYQIEQLEIAASGEQVETADDPSKTVTTASVRGKRG